MPTIKESAQAFKPKTAKNITELPSVEVTAQISTEIGKDLEGVEFSFNYITVNGEKYRLPDSVLKDLKNILEKKPSLKTFSVTKSGEGRQTRYTVIPLE